MQPIKLQDLKPGMAVQLTFTTTHRITGIFEGVSPALSSTPEDPVQLIQVKSGDQTVYWKSNMVTHIHRVEATR